MIVSVAIPWRGRLIFSVVQTPGFLAALVSIARPAVRLRPAAGWRRLNIATPQRKNGAHRERSFGPTNRN